MMSQIYLKKLIKKYFQNKAQEMDFPLKLKDKYFKI